MINMREVLGAALLLPSFLLLGGCMNRAAVRPVSTAYWVEELHHSALTENDLSEQTAVYLELRGWDEKALREPDQVVPSLRANLIKAPDRRGLVALAELAYWAGGKMDEPEQASEYYLMASHAAYAALFDPALGPPFDNIDPNLRFTADLYNYSLSMLANHVLDSGASSDDALVLELFGEKVAISKGDGILAADGVREVLIAYNFKAKSLEWHSRRRGLGVPIVTVSTRQTVVEGRNLVHPPVYESPVSPATLLLRFTTPWTNQPEEIHAHAELVYSFASTHAEIGREQVPLEADTSLALALVYGEKPEYRGYKNMLRFLRGGFMDENRGLYLLEPYDPSRIPVVFTHGLMDSSLTWIPMINELYNDPVLVARYQFWVFFYPTGNPVLQSASELRQSLLALKAQKDKHGEAWDNMVLVGHSMGGLITRLMVTHSDNLFEDSTEQVAQIAQGDKELEDYLKSLSTFEPVPAVKRAVFIAAPHRGASMAGRLSGRTGSVLIDEPDYIKAFISGKEGRRGKLKTMENGIDNLETDSVFSLALGDSVWERSIPVHSIIGDIRTAGRTTGSDGLVAYWSSHVEGAESELIPKSDHMSIHKSAASIAEVRRILVKHLE